MKKNKSRQVQNRSRRVPVSEHRTNKSVAAGIMDNRVSTALQQKMSQAASAANQTMIQRKMQTQLDESPRMALQRNRLGHVFGNSIQRVAGELEEGAVQGRFEAVQREAGIEEEELLQGRFDTAQRVEEEEDILQGRFDTAQRQGDLEEEELLQGKSLAMTSASQLQQEDVIHANATGIPDQLKAGIESLSGMDISDVQVHRNSSKPAQLNALAYAQGSEVHLGPGQEHHLPHEVWHVVQQRQGRVKPTIEMAGQLINDDAGLEQEADEMGEKALHHND